MEQSDTITLKTPQQPRHRLFAVASKKIHGRLSERSYWKDAETGDMYVIVQTISIRYKTQVPSVLQYMTFGRIFSYEEIWQKRCKNSDYLHFLICEPMEEE
jgi:hypothetical protein